MDDMKLAAAWRKGVAGPVWMLTSEAPVKLARWVPDEDKLRMETLEVSADSLLNGDGGWRPADPEEANEALELAQQASLYGDDSGHVAMRTLIGVNATPMSPGYRAERVYVEAADAEAMRVPAGDVSPVVTQHGEPQPDAVPVRATRDDSITKDEVTLRMEVPESLPDPEGDARRVDLHRLKGMGYSDGPVPLPERPFSPSDEARTCVPHGRRDCAECTPWIAAHAQRVAAAHAVREAFDPDRTNGELARWVEAIERGERGTEDDPLREPGDMQQHLDEQRAAREERWRRRAGATARVEEIARRTDQPIAVAERAWLRGQTVQTAHAEFMWLLDQVPAALVDAHPGLAEEVLSGIPAVARDGHGARFLIAEIERRAADTVTMALDDKAAAAALREELEAIKPRQLIADLQSVRADLIKQGPQLLQAIVELLERAEDAALGVTRPPLGMVPFLPLHDHEPDEPCSPGCAVFQWARHTDQFGNPYDAQGRQEAQDG